MDSEMDTFEQSSNYGSYIGNCKWFNSKIGYGFVTVENKYDQECATQQNSSWWYPMMAMDTLSTPSCEFNNTFNTNLNGVYHEDETLNKMGIAICSPSTVQCYEDASNWKIIKLSKVQMFLKRNKGKHIGK